MEHAFTLFPNLSIYDQDISSLELGEYLLPNFSKLEVSQETIIISWAMLLKAYTGDDVLKFMVDGSGVLVDSETWSIRPVAAETVRGAWITGISFICQDFNTIGPGCPNSTSFPGPHELALACQYHLSQGRGRLITSGAVPHNHLPEIGSQLQYIIERTLRLENAAACGLFFSVQPRLSIINQSPVGLGGPQLLHELVKQETGSAIAIEFLHFDGQRKVLSYGLLEQLSNSLAEKLCRSLTLQGVSETEQIVIPVLIPQSPELYIALLAILKAGGAFCPLGLDAPDDRIKFVLNDVSAKVVITTALYENRVPKCPHLSICLADGNDSGAVGHSNPTIRRSDPQNLAYVMYTSGSTGQPKGVSISHFAVTQSLLAHNMLIPHFLRFLQFASPTFDVAIFEIFFTLFRGSTLVGCDRSELLNDLPGMINYLQVDAAELTPTVVGSLLKSRSNVPGLMVLLTIGEMLTRRVIEEFGGSRESPGILWGMYGPTEAAIHCTLHPNFESRAKLGLIGRPLLTVSAFIVSPADHDGGEGNLEILPCGFIGELVVGGSQVALGYLKRKEQTEAAFCNHADYGRLYRTGDKARMLPDGTIECLGRIAFGQVKLRGQRIELQEVEKAAAKTSGCRVAVADVVEGNLVLFCFAEPGQVTGQQIRDTCRRWLPAYMMPNDVILVENLPRLSSGKIDRATLKTSYLNNRDENATGDRTIDDLEALVTEIASKVFRHGIHSRNSLSREGLDSLSAIHFASQLRSKGFNVGAIDILSAYDIAELCSTLRSKQNSSKPDNVAFLHKCHDLRAAVMKIFELQEFCSQIADILPCTPLQNSMLVETSLNPQAYCNWVELEFSDLYSVQDVMIALQKLIAGNEILRSGFIALENATTAYAQIIWDAVSPGQILTVETFDRDFRISDPNLLLQPFKLKLVNTQGGCRALFQIHHALYDGWSLDLILNDLDEILQAKDPCQRIQFRKVVEHHTVLAQEITALDQARDYWEARMAGYHPVAIPKLYGRQILSPIMRTSVYVVAFSPSDIRCNLDVHPQAVFQVALAYLLSLYLGTRDVVFGSVTSGRTIPVHGIEAIIGPCIATLPMRVQFTKTCAVEGLLHSVQTANRQALEHCELPLQDIKRLSGIHPGQRLFDVLFVWQESQVSTTGRSTTVRQVDSEDFLEFNLVVEIEPCSNHVNVKVRYRESMWPQVQINSFLEQLNQIVSHLVMGHQMSLLNFASSLSESTLSIANPEPTRRTSTSSLASYVENKARASPGRPAVTVATVEKDYQITTETLTYQELNERANKLAYFLLDEGLRPDDLVCVFMEKSLDLYIAILATIKAGAAYLPLTPETPQSRVELILQEANVQICLSRSTSPVFVRSSEFRTTVEVDNVNLTRYPTTNLVMPYIGSNLAYAVFTSGSTGVPKGVLVTQDNLASNIEVLAEIYPYTADSRLLQACSQAFDVSVFEIFFTWFSGMCLCTGTNDILFRDLENAIRQLHITHLSLTPTVAALIDPSNVPNVKFLVTSGEGVTELVFRRWTGRGLFNGYGPSETTNICSVNPNTQQDDSLNNVGPPLKNTSAFVAFPSDDNFELVPCGGIGELCFGGDQVFRGYLNMPDLTARKIYHHPQYGRIYRSGDMGRILHDGSIMVLGRLDDQVKLRGQRLELGEINSILIRSDAVQDCISIILTEQQSNSERLVCFWVRTGKSVGTGVAALSLEVVDKKLLRDLFQDLESLLPAYMIPTTLVPVTRLPMTVQGKIDKRKLAAVYENLTLEYLGVCGQNREDSTTAADWTDLERNIAAALAKTLKIAVPDIGRQTSFFTFGLDSISAISLVQSLASQTGSHVQVSQILRCSNVASLAAQIMRAGKTSSREGPEKQIPFTFSDTAMSDIRSSLSAAGRKIEKVRPCTPLQEAMLSAEASSAKARSYYNSIRFVLHQDVVHVKRCWEVMVERHDILRTCFVTTVDPRFAYAQVVLTHHDLPWVLVNTECEDLETVVDRDLRKALIAVDTMVPPFILTAINTGKEYHLLLLMHHALYDGEALAILLYEIEQVHHGHTLPDAMSFDTFLNQLYSIDIGKADAYWDSHLKDYISLPFPNLTGVPLTEGDDQILVTSQLLFYSLSELEYASRKASATLLSLCQAAWAKLLSGVLDDPDICFGNVVSGRTLAVDDVDRLVAPCFNTLPVRLLISPAMTNQDLIAELQNINANSLDFQFSALRRIQSRWSRNGQCLIDTLFILQKSLRKLDENLWSLIDDVGEMDFPVVCELTPNRYDNSLKLTLHLRNSVVGKKFIPHIFNMYNAALATCVDHPLGRALVLQNAKPLDFVRNAIDEIYIGAGQCTTVSKICSDLRTTCPGIERAALSITKPSRIVDRRLIMFLSVESKGGESSRERLSDAVRSEMFKIFPARFAEVRIVIVDNIPLSHTGGVDKKALRLKLNKLDRCIDEHEKMKSDEYEPDSIELSVRELFSQFANIPAKHIHWTKTIFQLGLDSINAIQIAKALRDQGFKVSGQDILENPTSRTLALFLQNYAKHVPNEPSFDFNSFDNEHRGYICRRLEISESVVEHVRPCTPTQAGMIAQFLHSRGKTYFNHAQFELSSGVDIQRLRTAWHSVYRKHEMLRTGFVTLNQLANPFAMICYRVTEMQLPWVDLACSEDPGLTLLGNRSAIAEETLRSFHRPAWRLSVSTSTSRTSMQFSGHHALYDAESMRTFFEDVERAYQGRELAIARPIEPLLAMILNASICTESESQKFWATKLQSASVVRFPNMTPLLVTQRTVCKASRVIQHPLPELEGAAKRLGVTLQAALQIAWAQILSAYTGETEVIFGVVLSGRDSHQADNTAFPSAITVPFHCVVEGENTKLLEKAMFFNSLIRKYQYTPLTQIQRWVGRPKEALFDTILVFQKAEPEGYQNLIWTLTDEEATVEYPVSLEVKPDSNNNLTLCITFWDDILPVEQAMLLLKQFDAVLSCSVLELGRCEDRNMPDTYPTELVSMQPPQNPSIPSEGRLLHELVEISAKKFPNRIALEFVPSLEESGKSQQWTYQELNTKGDQLAGLIHKHGLQTGSLIAICFENCADASFAALGILKAGCAFLAIDPAAPAARKAFMMEDSKAVLMLTTTTLAQDFTNRMNGLVIATDKLDLETNLGDELKTAQIGNANAASYCLYTSGSTGTPKCCVISHENAVQALAGFERVFAGRWDRDSRWLQFASFHFDVSVLEQFWSWSVGICVVSAPRDVLFEDMTASLRRLRITHIVLTPSLARLVMPAEVPLLRKGLFITGGELLKQEILDAWGSTGVIYNAYGPTECTIGAMIYPGVPANGKPSNIGWQFDNVGTYIFRPGTTELVLRGGVGELCISGKLVGMGYLNRPELTAERFPYLHRFGARVYRTGDLVRCHHDRSFEFLGRFDDQVKLRGQRLELGEIDRIIRGSSKVVQNSATIIVKHPQKQTDQLIAFVVFNYGMTENADTSLMAQDAEMTDHIRISCQERLPGYMVPSQVLVVQFIPLTTTNKVDIKRLRELALQIFAGGGTSVSTGIGSYSNELSVSEGKVAKVLKNFLKLSPDSISRDSNIFHLGLDSISVFGFSRALRTEGFRGAYPSQIMKNETISGLSKAISIEVPVTDGSVMTAKQAIAACQQRNRSVVAKLLEIEIENIQRVAPCTPIQQGMIVRSLESGIGLYFNSFTLELSPNIDLARLQSAWEIVHRNVPILRTCFVPVHDGYVQATLWPSALLWIHMKKLDDVNIDRFLEERRLGWYQRNTEIIREPLEIAVTIVPGKILLIIHIFHGLYDATSLPLLLRKVAEEYDKYGSVEYGPQFSEVLPYGPLRQAEGAKEFWTSHLKHARHPKLPPPLDKTVSVVSSASVDLTDLASFEPKRRELNVTHQALVQICWLAVLQKYFASPTTVGMVVSGRSIAFQNAEQTIGPLFNTIPVYLSMNRNDTWKSSAQKCHEFNVAALTFQHTSLRDIARWCMISGGQQLFDTLFVFQKGQDETAAQAPKLWKQLPGIAQADYLLSFEAEQTAQDRLHLTIVAQTSFVDHGLCKSLLKHFTKAFMALLDNSDGLVSDTIGLESYTDDASLDVDISELETPYTNDLIDFEWTEEAKLIRDEVAHLAGIECSSLDERTSVFQIGLDSIDVIKLSSRLNSRAVKLRVSTIMRNPTVLGMMAQIESPKPFIDNRGKNGKLKNLVQALKYDMIRSGRDMLNFEDVLPTTPLQEAMVVDMYESNFSTYFNHDLFQLAPDVDITLLKRAWDAVITQSPILRTSFARVEDPDLECVVVQVVHKTKYQLWGDIELSDTEVINDVFERITHEMAESHAERVPLKITFISECHTKYMVLSMAHALYDGWSLTLLHNDVRKAYTGVLVARPDYKSCVERILDGANADAESYWRGVLSGTTNCTFPTGPNRDGHFVYRAKQESHISLKNIQLFCRSQSVTLQALFQTCWTFVLGSYTRSLDVVFGVVLSGRNDEESQSTLFPTMNTVAVRSVIHGSRSEMLQYMQANLGDLLQYQHFPLRKAQALAGLGGHKLFDTLLIYQKRPDVDVSYDALYESVGGVSAVEYPVCVETELVDDCLIWRTACRNNFLSENGTTDLLRHLDRVLQTIIDEPDASAIKFNDDDTIAICDLASFQMMDPSLLTGSSQVLGVVTCDVGYENWSPAEQAVREVLSLVSKVPESEIVKSHTIFHLGLDSISAIKVATLLRKRLMRLSVSEILRTSTVEKIAAAIEQAKSKAIVEEVNHREVLSNVLSGINIDGLIAHAGHQLDNVEDVLPATPGQVYLLSMWHNSGGVLFYPTFTYRLSGSIEMRILHDAWNNLVSHNPILRTVFATTGDCKLPFVQAVLNQVNNSFFEGIPYTPCPTIFIKNQTNFFSPSVQLFAREFEGALELDIRIHHALYDAVSLPMLIQELQDHYNQVETSKLHKCSFADFIVPGMSRRAQQVRQQFWSEYLKGYHAQPSSKDNATCYLPRITVYQPHVFEDIDRLGLTLRKHGLSLQSLFLASFAAVYASHLETSPEKDLVLGVYLANRSHPIDVIGELAAPTVNMVPLRARSPLKTTMLASAKQIQKNLQAISTAENSYVGLWEIQEWTGVTVDCFVNFLKLPDGQDSGSQDDFEGTGKDAVIIRKIDPLSSGAEEKLRAGPEVPASFQLFQDNAMRSCFKPCIDVEAAVRHGALDVGVFAPEQLLGRVEAEGMIDGIIQRLRAFLEGEG